MWIIIPLSMLPLVFAAVLGPIAHELYYLGYATSKHRLQRQNDNYGGKAARAWAESGPTIYSSSIAALIKDCRDRERCVFCSDDAASQDTARGGGSFHARVAGDATRRYK